VHVRRATDDDVPAITALHAAAVEAFGPRAYSEEQVEAWAAPGEGDWPPVAAADRHVVVCERESALAGFGDLDLTAGEVCGVYVHPDHAREGVGTTLLDHLEETAADAGHESASLLASKNAVGFYERRGYERTETVTHATTGDVTLECVRMKKPLADEPL